MDVVKYIPKYTMGTPSKYIFSSCLVYALSPAVPELPADFLIRDKNNSNMTSTLIYLIHTKYVPLKPKLLIHFTLQLD